MTHKPAFRRPEWIFFDLDDTLWDFASNSLKSLRHVYDSFHQLSDAFATFEDFADEYHVHNARMWKDFADGKISSDFIKTERWRLTLFPEGDPADPPAFCAELNTEYLEYLASLPYPVEGALETLESLRKDFMIAGLSNGFADTQYKKLKNSGLWRYVTRMVVSDETGITKPHRGLFDYAVAETGATGIPVMVGDNPDTDILGALRAGWRAIWFNRFSDDGFPYDDARLREMGIDPALFLGTAHSLPEAARMLTPLKDESLPSISGA